MEWTDSLFLCMRVPNNTIDFGVRFFSESSDADKIDAVPEHNQKYGIWHSYSRCVKRKANTPKNGWVSR
eukprot:scaffold253044_cov41-Attheya_sp.AAC.3